MYLLQKKIVKIAIESVATATTGKIHTEEEISSFPERATVMNHYC